MTARIGREMKFLFGGSRKPLRRRVESLSDDEFITVAEVAALTSLDEATIRRAIVRGYIEAARPAQGLVLASATSARRYAEFLRSERRVAQHA